MPRIRRSASPQGVTILDLVLLTAGFACGLVVHRSSVIGPSEFYILPSGRGPFHSLMDLYIVGGGSGPSPVDWLLRPSAAGSVTEAGCTPQEWLALSLAIVLVNSAFPAFRPERAGSMGQEIVWVDWSGDGKPVGFYLWKPERSNASSALAAIAIRMTAAATLIAAAAWMLRTKIRGGWAVVPLIAIALFVTLGPMRPGRSNFIGSDQLQGLSRHGAPARLTQFGRGRGSPSTSTLAPGLGTPRDTLARHGRHRDIDEPYPSRPRVALDRMVGLRRRCDPGVVLDL